MVGMEMAWRSWRWHVGDGDGMVRMGTAWWRQDDEHGSGSGGHEVSLIPLPGGAADEGCDCVGVCVTVCEAGDGKESGCAEGVCVYTRGSVCHKERLWVCVMGKMQACDAFGCAALPIPVLPMGHPAQRSEDTIGVVRECPATSAAPHSPWRSAYPLPPSLHRLTRMG